MNVQDVLDRLGIDYELVGDEATAPCPSHTDNNPSWGINLDSGLHFCFSCGYRGHLYGLVKDVLKLGSFEEAKEWVGSDVIDVDVVVEKARKRSSVSRVLRIESVASEAELLSFPEPPSELASSRNLTKETCDLFGLRYHLKYDAWVLPIRDEAGGLMGWQYKSKEWVRNWPPGVRKRRSLFGYHLLDEHQEEVVVVESPLDAALAVQAGFPAVATFGDQVSDAQVNLLAGRVPILALDNDVSGRRSQVRLSERLTAVGIRHRHVIWGDRPIKDFGDDPSAIEELVTSSLGPLRSKMIARGA